MAFEILSGEKSVTGLFILECVIVELSRSPSWVADDRMYTTTRNLLIA